MLCVRHPYYLGNYKGFRSFWSGTRFKDQILAGTGAETYIHSYFSSFLNRIDEVYIVFKVTDQKLQ